MKTVYGVSAQSLALLLLAACGAPKQDHDPTRSQAAPLTVAEVLADSLAVFEESAESDSVSSEETLRAKILRGHPDLLAIDELFRESGASYFASDLDLAEESLYILKERLAMAREAGPDSLALLYLGSMERKLEHLAELLTEERFFSDSYAPRNSTLEETYRELRQAYGIPEFLLPSPAQSLSQFERELLSLSNERVDEWTRAFTGRLRDNFELWLERKQQIGHVIEGILEDEGLPRELIYLSLIESGLSPAARSRASAVGYWQFIRGTARNRGLRVDEWVDERRDIELSTRAAARHLKLLFGMFGNWPLALAAYNAGEYRIQRAIGLQDDVDYWDLRLPRETREYVPKYIAAARIGRDPQKYGFAIAPTDTLRYDVVELDDAYSLDQLARAWQIEENDLRTLNPQLIASCTPPLSDRYSLRVPSGRGEGLAEIARDIPESERLNWRRHRFGSGETIGQLARRYQTSVQAILDLNGIRDPRKVRAGRVLIIPFPRGFNPSLAALESNPDPAPTSSSTHIVRRGETLSSIARESGHSIEDIRRFNGLSSSQIRTGQRLRLPAPGQLLEMDEATHERTEYLVERGDTLSSIGRHFQVEVGDLLRWNGLRSDGHIRPGDRLWIWRPRGGG